MDRKESINAIIELANLGTQISPTEAVHAVAQVISEMCPAGRNYDARLAVLLQVGATLWHVSSAAGMPLQSERMDSVQQKGVEH
ncbi:hypothetical protein [Delftia tsuruhatensis]|uniref:hypothetical protein n=1 Tax=Delftia tsuruhatensis TaxID=180282 RepID=UPI0031DE6D18